MRNNVPKRIIPLLLILTTGRPSGLEAYDLGTHEFLNEGAALISRLDTQLRMSGMRDALRSGDIDKALWFIAVDSRDEFRADFTALAPFLPQIGQELEDIHLVEIRGNEAEYELLSQENGETFSYYVEFVLDDDGIWRLAFF